MLAIRIRGADAVPPEESPAANTPRLYHGMRQLAAENGSGQQRRIPLSVRIRRSDTRRES